MSLALWDHTVLPATQHKWTHPAFTPARQAGTRFTDHLRVEGWVSPGPGCTLSKPRIWTLFFLRLLLRINPRLDVEAVWRSVCNFVVIDGCFSTRFCHCSCSTNVIENYLSSLSAVNDLLKYVEATTLLASENVDNSTDAKTMHIKFPAIISQLLFSLYKTEELVFRLQILWCLGLPSRTKKFIILNIMVACFVSPCLNWI